MTDFRKFMKEQLARQEAGYRLSDEVIDLYERERTTGRISHTMVSETAIDMLNGLKRKYKILNSKCCKCGEQAKTEVFTGMKFEPFCSKHAKGAV